MAYTINKFNGEELVVLQDGTLDTSTSIGLVGRNYVGYGETQNENFVFLLENFANDNPPGRPVTGQMWFDTSKDLMYAYDGGQWNVIGSTEVSDTAPTTPSQGAFWLKTPENSLYVYSGTEWVIIGPESVNGFGATRTKATVLTDDRGGQHAVLQVIVDDDIVAIITAEAFDIGPDSTVPGFGVLVSGLNLSLFSELGGDIAGNAGSASRLSADPKINGILFDGSQDVTIKASTTNKLIGGDYIVGNDFDGSSSITWSVDATSANQIGKIVARNSAGGFSATTVTADTFIGNLQGNVTATSGTSTFDVIQANQIIGNNLSSSSLTANRLQTARTINGVAFDGTQNITVPAAAGTLTGNTLASNVTFSSLSRLGTLEEVNVSDPGINIGATDQFKLFLDTAVPTIKVTESNKELNLEINSAGTPADINFIPASQSLALGGESKPSFVPGADGTMNLGNTNRKWDKIYSNRFVGNADTATLATNSTNIAGGGAGSIVYQSGASTTTFLSIGSPGQILTAGSSNTLTWSNINRENLAKGSYLTFTGGDGSNYNGSSAVTIAVDATDANTASKVVARDASGNFSASTITATFVGNITGNLTGTADTALTATTQSANDNSTKIATTAYVDSGLTNLPVGVGVGQTWQQLKTSRAIGTTYTNSTGKPILVNMTAEVATWGYYIVASVGSVEVGRDRDNGSASAGKVWLNISFLVPNGATYKVDAFTNSDTSTTGTITSWAELR